MKQITLKRLIKATGVGLHSGVKVSIIIRPAPENTGIIFRRVDLTPPVSISAIYSNVCDTRLCTTLQQDGAKVATVEHLLSAFAGLGIDNAYVDVDGPELPIMDGSSAPFVFLIQSAGIKEQNAEKRFIRIKKPIRVEDQDKHAEFRPFEGYKIDFTINFDHPVFEGKPQRAIFDFSVDSYLDVCRARTFAFLKDYEFLRANNLAKGGSLDTAVVVDDYRVINEDGLRFDSEFVDHKVLDAMGDLSLFGCNLLGYFKGYKSGHELNNRLIHQVMATQDAWEYTTFTEKKQTFNYGLLKPCLVET